MKNILILCGGPSSEYEVSILSTKVILLNIDKSIYKVTVGLMNNTKEVSFMSSSDFLTGKYPKYISYRLALNEMTIYDFVFLAMHGEFGEDGGLQKVFEKKGIKFQGSGSISSKLCFDKYKASRLIYNKLKVKYPKTIKLKPKNISKYKLEYPILIKPNKIGSSLGAAIINSKNELDSYLKSKSSEHYFNDFFLIQEYIKGIEVTCGVLEEKNGKCILLPPVEIFPKGEFFDYKSKYTDHGSTENCPPTLISKSVCDEISEITRDIHKLLKCKTYSRTDYIYSNSKLYYLDTNTLPGMTKNSLLPKEVKEIGMTYKEFITFLIEES